MRFPLDEQLIREATEFRLRGTCEHCLFWSRAKQACWHGWPDDGQRTDPLVRLRAGEKLDEYVFCKEFELG